MKPQATAAAAQLDLFATGVVCSVCGRDHGRRPNNPALWHGFKDGSTGQLVGRPCRTVYYRRMAAAMGGNVQYTEMPVVIGTPSF